MLWSEEHTMALTDNMIEDVLGDVTPLPDIDYSLPLYVQVDTLTGTKYKAISKTRERLEASPEAHWRYYGVDNFFAGIQAGNLTMTGVYNTAIGYASLNFNTTGTSNTATGYYSLLLNSTGGWNTAIGSASLFYNTLGYYNTASGAEALYSNISGTSNTASGNRALLFNTTGSNNTANGADTLQSNTSGHYNTASGYSALYSNITGNNNTAIGYFADVSSGNLSNATAIGYNAKVNASNKVVIGNNSVTTIGGYAAWSNFSDLRSKADIQDIGYGLDLIRQLRPVSFKMKNGNNNTDFGFVAQEIEALIGTEYNVLDIGGGDERMLSLRYTQFIAPMVKAMQEQQEIIEEQQSQIQAQRMMIEQLMADMKELRKRIQ